MRIVRSFVSSSIVSGGIIGFLCFILYDVAGAVLYWTWAVLSVKGQSYWFCPAVTKLHWCTRMRRSKVPDISKEDAERHQLVVVLSDVFYQTFFPVCCDFLSVLVKKNVITSDNYACSSFFCNRIDCTPVHLWRHGCAMKEIESIIKSMITCVRLESKGSQHIFNCYTGRTLFSGSEVFRGWWLVKPLDSEKALHKSRQKSGRVETLGDGYLLQRAGFWQNRQNLFDMCGSAWLHSTAPRPWIQ